jgi:hypothetical protein
VNTPHRTVDILGDTTEFRRSGTYGSKLEIMRTEGPASGGVSSVFE